MSRARLLLHLAALLLPFAVAALLALMVDRDPHYVLRWTLIFGSAGVLSAQIAALLRWRAIERRARAGGGGWIAGVGMAAITHFLFGIVIVIALAIASGGWEKSAGNGSPSDFAIQVLFFIVASTLPLGVLTFPLTAGLAEGVCRMRRKEFADAAR